MDTPSRDGPVVCQIRVTAKASANQAIDAFLVACAHLQECLLRHPPNAIHERLADCQIHLHRVARALGWEAVTAELCRITDAHPRPPLYAGEYKPAQVAMAKAQAALLYHRHDSGSREDAIHHIADCIREIALTVAFKQTRCRQEY